MMHSVWMASGRERYVVPVVLVVVVRRWWWADIVVAVLCVQGLNLGGPAEVGLTEGRR